MLTRGKWAFPLLFLVPIDHPFIQVHNGSGTDWSSEEIEQFRLRIQRCRLSIVVFIYLITKSSIPDGLLYQFDKETSQLTDKRFEFNLYPEHAKNQKHYEALGEVRRLRYIV